MKHKEPNEKLIEELRKALEQRGLSPERAAPFFEVNFRTLYRWLNYESSPTGLSRKAIRQGIRRIRKIK